MSIHWIEWVEPCIVNKRLDSLMLRKHLSIFLQKFNQKSTLDSFSTIFIQEGIEVDLWGILLLNHFLVFNLFLLFFYYWLPDWSHVLPNFSSCQWRLLLLFDQLLRLIFIWDFSILCLFSETFLFLKGLIGLQKFCPSFVLFHFLVSYFVEELLCMRSNLTQSSIFHVFMNLFPVFAISLQKGFEKIWLSSGPPSNFVPFGGHSFDGGWHLNGFLLDGVVHFLILKNQTNIILITCNLNKYYLYWLFLIRLGWRFKKISLFWNKISWICFVSVLFMPYSWFWVI